MQNTEEIIRQVKNLIQWSRNMPDCDLYVQTRSVDNFDFWKRVYRKYKIKGSVFLQSDSRIVLDLIQKQSKE